MSLPTALLSLFGSAFVPFSAFQMANDREVCDEGKTSFSMANGAPSIPMSNKLECGMRQMRAIVDRPKLSWEYTLATEKLLIVHDIFQYFSRLIPLICFQMISEINTLYISND